jgi:predicted RNA-binding Zn ribbon-like protein
MAMESSRPVVFELIGGHPALDFVNTVGGVRVTKPKEHLSRFSDLLAWGSQVGVLSAAEAKALGKQALAHPQEAAASLERAQAFREALFRLFLALVEGRPAPAADAASLEAEVQRALAARRLQPTETGGYAWAQPVATLKDSVVPRLALASVELLTGEGLRRVRTCEATATEECGWLFLDQTRNHSRRWCDMATCGNQHKARRHYARVRGRS